MFAGEVGDYVLCALPERTKAHKLYLNWHGPYKIKGVVQGRVSPRFSSGEDAVDESSWLYEVHLCGRPTQTETMHACFGYVSVSLDISSTTTYRLTSTHTRRPYLAARSPKSTAVLTKPQQYN